MHKEEQSINIDFASEVMEAMGHGTFLNCHNKIFLTINLEFYKQEKLSSKNKGKINIGIPRK